MSLPIHLQNLNPQQLEAVRHGAGPLLIFAGAGSGKTRVLTRRIANLVLEHKVDPAQIFAVTFTNKAASEMKQRVQSLFQGQSTPSWVSTFHSSCVRILRGHAKYLDFNSNFVIYDSSDSKSALKRVYRKLNIDPRVLDIRMVRSRIDRAKNDYLSPEDIRRHGNFGGLSGGEGSSGLLSDMIADVYEEYQKELQSSNAMDFGDLICNVVTLFMLEPSLLEHYQERFKYILVDEYQDTNKVQYKLIQLLTKKRQNICVVGDDDQSIYAFRGATIENILNFQKDYPKAKVITLQENYRSTKNILHAASAVIARNKERHKKVLRTSNPVGDAIVGHKAFDEHHEAEFVAREIATLRKKGVSLADIAVFYRVNAQSRVIEEALVENAIAYEIFGGHKFYDRKEIKDILAYFKLLLNPNDNEAFLRVINTPARGLGAVSIGALAAFAEKQGLSLLKALKIAVLEKASFVSKNALKKFTQFLTLIEELGEEANKAEAMLHSEFGALAVESQLRALSVLLETIAVKSTYLEKLRTADTPEALTRVENIYELFNVAADFVKNAVEEGSTPTLGCFLDRASLSSDLDKENTKEETLGAGESSDYNGSVSLMTLHLAKGLEFNTVFMLGLEEGLLPHANALDHPKEVEEERRLCYVGMTRAKKKLYMTRARSRQSFGYRNFNVGFPSQFLGDLPPDTVDDRHTKFLESYY